MSESFIKVANKSLESVMKFRYPGMMVTNENCIHEEVKEQNTSGEYFLPCSSESFVFSTPV